MKFKLKQNRTIDEQIKVEILSFFGQILFWLNSRLMVFKNVNHPDTENKNFIFACFHSQQCGLYAIKNREKLYSLVSQSMDGDLIAASGGRVGMKMIRGSSRRGGSQATRELIDKIENGNSIAIAVDGPTGPVGVPKKGVIEIAKMTNTSIIPMVWHGDSPLMLKIPTWDKLQIPLLFVNTVAVYGEPIYVPADCNEEQLKEIKDKLQETLAKMNADIKANFRKYYKEGIQNKHKSKSVVKWFLNE